MPKRKREREEAGEGSSKKKKKVGQCPDRAVAAVCCMAVCVGSMPRPWCFFCGRAQGDKHKRKDAAAAKRRKARERDGSSSSSDASGGSDSSSSSDGERHAERRASAVRASSSAADSKAADKLVLKLMGKVHATSDPVQKARLHNKLLKLLADGKGTPPTGGGKPATSVPPPLQFKVQRTAASAAAPSMNPAEELARRQVRQQRFVGQSHAGSPEEVGGTVTSLHAPSRHSARQSSLVHIACVSQ